MENLNDESPMPYGIHKNEKMIDVPASYLLFLYENGKCNQAVKEYVVDNLDCLKMEVRK
jgi:uncharacterized protein (DUF3820 family)